MQIGNLNEEQIRKFARILSPNDYLFRQDDLGNTMFIIINGEMEIVEQRGEAEFIVGVLGAGQLIGEKAFLTEAPYRRTYSGRAKKNTTLLEFERKHIKIVEAIIPDFALRILGVAAQRLDRANKIINVLRHNDPIDKLIHAVLFYKEENGKKVPEGYHLEVTVDDLLQLTNLNRDLIQRFFDACVRSKALRPIKTGYLLSDENVLKQMLPDLQESLS